MEEAQHDLEKLTIVADMLKAIAHPYRVAIIDLLEKNQKMSVSEIFQELSIEQAVASHHLGILKNKDVLASERDGKNIFYFLKHDSLIDIIRCVESCQDC
jgi:DNA-binding transcriptional ArsR family regulator